MLYTISLILRLENCNKVLFLLDAISNEEEINQELVARVRSMIGPIASFRVAAAVTALPKTRSGKLIRKSVATLARSKPFKVGFEYYRRESTFRISSVYPPNS